MKKIFFSCVVLLASLGATAQPNPKPSTYHDQRTSLFGLLSVGPKDIVFLGNSITDGCEWAELFGNSHVKNRGIGGDRSWDIFESLGPILKGQPKKVFLMIGTNDLGMFRTSEQVLDNIRKIAERFRTESPRTKLYIQSILPVNSAFGNDSGRNDDKGVKIRAVNEGLMRMCAERGLTYIDLWTPLADNEGKLDVKYTNDGLHLTGPGYQVWKEKIKKYVK